MEEEKKKKNRGRTLNILIAAAAVILVLLVVAFWSLIREVIDRRGVDSQMSEMQSAYSKDETSSEEQSEPSGSDVSYEVNSRFNDLLAQNPDTVGWLEVEGIGYDGAVVQKDNSYYLTTDFYGNSSSYGAIFASQYNNLDPNKEKSNIMNGQYIRDPSLNTKGADDNIILYGHNLLLVDAANDDHSNDRMFNNLVKYRRLDFFEQYPFWTFDTLWEDGDWVVVAVFIANTESEHGEPFLYNTMRTFASDADKQTFIDEVMKRSLILTDTDVSVSDRFLTLSTCDYDFSDERCVVVARKLREGETKEDLTGRKVWLNESPLMPDIWNEIYGK